MAEEAVAVGAEARRVHRVGGAGLQVVLGAVLAAGAYGLVVVDAVRSLLDRVPVAPDEAVERGDRDSRVRALVGHRPGDAVDVLAGDERAGALDEEDHVDGPGALGLVDVHRVQHGRFAGGRVARDGGGALDAVQPVGGPQVGGGAPGGLGDRPVVGGDDDVGDLGGAERGADGAGDQGDAADLGEVLGGDAFGSAAGGDHGEDGRGHGGCSWSGVHSSPIRRITGATRWTPWR
ncbi:hypothetical protein M2436_004710 [Streptomyces sp. HB372]|nr:hypothetical protein [Streptomyces sp. HB372]